MTRGEAGIAELPTEAGARLRRQRESEGLSEQQAAEKLNLDPAVVIGIERDDYAALGAPVFVRGHLKRYAALLGLSEDEVLGAYDRSRSQLPQPTLIPRAREEMPPPRSRARRPWLAGGAALFLLAAALAAYVSEYGFHLPRTGAGQQGLSDSAGQAGDATATAGGVPARATGAGVASTATPQGQVALAFDFSADSWIEVYDASGGMVLYDLARGGTQRVVMGTAPLKVTLGNAPVVALSVNGRRVDVPPPPPGETVARFGVGPGGTLRQDAG